jgi:Sec-independent protein translocase protein TatA
MLGFGTPEVILVAIVAVVVVGAARFPYTGRGSQRDGGLARPPKAWTRSDWILIAGVALLGVVAVGLALSRR